MEFLKININSTKPFYTDKDGKIYNQNYKELKCSKLNDSLFLAYVLNDSNRTPCKHSVARLIYKTYHPKLNLEKYNIFKKKLDIENPYQIGNLKRVLKTKMPVQNKLPARHKSKRNPIKRKFYQKISKPQFNILIQLAKSPTVKNSTISKLYDIHMSTVRNNRPFLSKQKTKTL